MSELHLEPCPHCGCSLVKVINWNGSTLTAAQCRACGARGPVRPIMADNDIAAVHALAADDWNIRFPLGETQATLERVDAESISKMGEAICESISRIARPRVQITMPAASLVTGDRDKVHPPERSPVEGQEDRQETGGANDESGGGPPLTPSTPAPDNSDAVVASPNTTQGEAINQGNPCLQAPSPTQEAPTPGDGGGKGTPKRKYKKRQAKAQRKANRHPIAERIEAYFKVTGKNVYSGLFSISDQGIKNILDGAYPRAVTLNTIERELDKLEKSLPVNKATVEDMKKEDPAGEVGPSIAGIPADFPVEELPNSLPPIKRLNPLPSMTPPARCSKVT